MQCWMVKFRILMKRPMNFMVEKAEEMGLKINKIINLLYGNFKIQDIF